MKKSEAAKLVGKIEEEIFADEFEIDTVEALHGKAQKLIKKYPNSYVAFYAQKALESADLETIKSHMKKAA